MSHVSSVKAYVTDLKVCAAACEEIGLELVTGATSYRWYGKWVNDYSGGAAAVSNGHDPKTFGTCEHKIRVKGAGAHTYEIGLVRRLDGGPGWELLYDNWCGGQGLEAVAGAGLGKLKQTLAQTTSIQHLQKQGYRVTKRVDEQGRIHIGGIK